MGGPCRDRALDRGDVPDRASSRITTTYTRADLGIATALVAGTPEGQWEAHLYYGPEPDEHNTETVDSKSAAERLAIGHSLTF